MSAVTAIVGGGGGGGGGCCVEGVEGVEGVEDVEVVEPNGVMLRIWQSREVDVLIVL